MQLLRRWKGLYRICAYYAVRGPTLSYTGASWHCAVGLGLRGFSSDRVTPLQLGRGATAGASARSSLKTRSLGI